MKDNTSRVCPVEGAKVLDNFFRKMVQNPKKILKDYVREGMTVLDVGCGPGFFSVEMADMVGASGKVIAADLQQGMLDIIKIPPSLKLPQYLHLYRLILDMK